MSDRPPRGGEAEPPRLGSWLTSISLVSPSRGPGSWCSTRSRVGVPCGLDWVVWSPRSASSPCRGLEVAWRRGHGPLRGGKHAPLPDIASASVRLQRARSRSSPRRAGPRGRHALSPGSTSASALASGEKRGILPIPTAHVSPPTSTWTRFDVRLRCLGAVLPGLGGPVRPVSRSKPPDIRARSRWSRACDPSGFSASRSSPTRFPAASRREQHPAAITVLLAGWLAAALLVLRLPRGLSCRVAKLSGSLNRMNVSASGSTSIPYNFWSAPPAVFLALSVLGTPRPRWPRCCRDSRSAGAGRAAVQRHFKILCSS